MLTTEQNNIVEFISRIPADDQQIVLIDAVAGAGKTFLLQHIVGTIPHTSGLYLGYNKSIVTEATTKFPESISCVTINALAYRNTVKRLGLDVGFFNFKSIKERISYDLKCDVVEQIKAFCLSRHTSFEEFAESNFLGEVTKKLCQSYLTKMSQGTAPCTHDFYLKIFHMMLANGSLTFNKYDFLMIDEAGDVNEVALEIVKLLPARVKIIVGDKRQNIYAFNHTVNAFSLLAGEGTSFPLTQSFRVEENIAKGIQSFCKNYIDPNMTFTGVPYEDTSDVKTTAYLTRTNSDIVGEIVRLTAEGEKFRLTRGAKEIFSLPLIVATLRYEGEIFDRAYKYLQTDVNDWYESDSLKREYRTLYMYLSELYPHDKQLLAAININRQHKKSVLFEAFERAKELENSDATHTLGTSHSTKGLEFDSVYISQGLNDAVTAAVANIGMGQGTEEDEQELNLYYVACSRAKKQLHNARLCYVNPQENKVPTPLDS